MKECFLIISYCDTDLKLEVLNECIDNVKQFNLDVCVYAHYPLPVEIQDKVNEYIYDYSNPVMTYPQSGMLFWRNYKNYKMKIFLEDYGYAVLQMIKRGYSFLSKRYDKITILNYDVHIDYQIVEIINNKLLNNDSVLFYWENKKLNPTIIGLNSNLNLDFINLENYTKDRGGDAEKFIDSFNKELKCHKCNHDEYKDAFYVKLGVDGNRYKLNTFPTAKDDGSPWFLYLFDHYKIHIGEYHGKVAILFFTIDKPLDIKFSIGESTYKFYIEDEEYFHIINVDWLKFTKDSFNIYVNNEKIEEEIIDSFINRQSKIEII